MSVTTPIIPSANGAPAWEAAFMLPVQGSWSEEEFLKFHTNRMAELVDGRLEILPTLKHQRILRWLLGMFEGAAPVGLITLFAPLPTRLFPGTIREPDLLYLAPENAPGPDVDYPTHIDLAVEIVKPGKEVQRQMKCAKADWCLDREWTRMAVVIQFESFRMTLQPFVAPKSGHENNWLSRHF